MLRLQCSQEMSGVVTSRVRMFCSLGVGVRHGIVVSGVGQQHSARCGSEAMLAWAWRGIAPAKTPQA